MPKPNRGESKSDFLSRCMSDEEALTDFPDQKQRYAFCNSQWRRSMSKFTKEFEIQKLDEDQRIAFGWASVIEVDGRPVVDAHGDVIKIETLEKAAYNFVLSSRAGGDMHEKQVARLIESIVFSREKQEALGIDLGKVGYWVGFKIDDADTWAAIKSGERPMLSIGGRAKREVLDGDGTN